MSAGKRALLLIGSPKPERSTSESLGTYLLDRLKELGWTTGALRVNSAMRSDERRDELVAALDLADVVILAFPLYVDSLPAGATRALELIAEHRKPGILPPTVVTNLRKIVELVETEHVEGALGLIAMLLNKFALPFFIGTALRLLLKSRGVSGMALGQVKRFLRGMERKDQAFVAVCNSGLPEAFQCDVAIDICKEFAWETGMTWGGGLALGGGAAIDGKPLYRAGGMVRNVRAALDLAAKDLAAGRPVSKEAIGLMARPLVGSRVYAWMANVGWALQGLKNRVFRRLWGRPYRGV
jgi:hypothetical protein